MAKSTERGGTKAIDEPLAVRKAKAWRLGQERVTAFVLSVVFLAAAGILWIPVGKMAGRYIVQLSMQGLVEFSGWFIVALALAMLFTVLAAVGLWVVIGGFMYARFAGLPPGGAGADQPPAPPPRIDYRH
jgi:hypothetical protein